MTDPWHFLRNVTAARIALGRCGGSLPTREWLEFSLAHARAQDAVHEPFNADAVRSTLQSAGLQSILASSAAIDRDTYLRRPDLGRTLSAASRTALVTAAGDFPATRIVDERGTPSDRFDLAVVISDGLSAPAAQQHAAAVTIALVERLQADGWLLPPVIIVPNGRVAIQDEIGEIVEAALSLMLLGERPGLGAPDSLGAYFVYNPRVGRTDAERNCVSNIRPGGLPIEFAVETLHHLLTAARSRRLSGVTLKDERSLLS